MFRPKWLGWHALMVAAVLGMLALGDWQLRRAEAGNGLSWAYTFEWPIFAGFAIVFWAKTIKDEFRPPGPRRGPGQRRAAGGTGRDGRPAPAPAPGRAALVPLTTDDEELAAYNAYLARLTAEASRHGKWHGLR